MIAENYRTDGYVGGVRVLSSDQAADHRRRLEHVESAIASSLHYIDKAHTALASPFELATLPAVLDVVEELIGPDILLYNSTYIIKEPGAPTKVLWHQDLTYWGLADDDAQVSMWLALAPATVESGAMMMLPGTHLGGAVTHQTNSNDANLLLLGQHIPELDASQRQHCTLEPGEASFHHGWTIHSSQPNVSNDRRIGLNVQFLAPHNSMSSGVAASAMLVRGEDHYGNFATDERPPARLDEQAVARWREADSRMKANFKQR